MVRTPCFAFTDEGQGLIPGQGTNILQAAMHGQKKKKIYLRSPKYDYIGFGAHYQHFTFSLGHQIMHIK